MTTSTRNVTLLSGILAVAYSLSASASGLACTQSPDCASLGYTTNLAECSKGIAVICPTDSLKVFCKKKPAETAVECNGNVGAILYGDGTVVCGLVTGKTPIGIVFDETNRLAVALTDVNNSGAAVSSQMTWSSSYCDVLNLTNCVYNDKSVDTCRVDGRANTAAILATNSSCSGTTNAANGANGYEPSGCSKDFCKKKKWFLPSMRDLATLYNAKSYVNASLSLTASSGAKTLEKYYWSSNEYGYDSVWKVNMTDGLRLVTSKSGYNYVRPVVNY